MKKYALWISLVFVSANAQAFQTPAQQSAGIVRAVTQAILDDGGLALLSISKIAVGDSHAKAELRDAKGRCLAIPYQVSYDAFGEASVEVDKAALSRCEL